MTAPEWVALAVGVMACVLLAAACFPDWRAYLRSQPDLKPIRIDPPGRCLDHPDGSCADHDSPHPRTRP